MICPGKLDHLKVGTTIGFDIAKTRSLAAFSRNLDYFIAEDFQSVVGACAYNDD